MKPPLRAANEPTGVAMVAAILVDVWWDRSAQTNSLRFLLR